MLPEQKVTSLKAPARCSHATQKFPSNNPGSNLGESPKSKPGRLDSVRTLIHSSGPAHKAATTKSYWRYLAKNMRAFFSENGKTILIILMVLFLFVPLPILVAVAVETAFPSYVGVNGVIAGFIIFFLDIVGFFLIIDYYDWRDERKRQQEKETSP